MTLIRKVLKYSLYKSHGHLLPAYFCTNSSKSTTSMSQQKQSAIEINPAIVDDVILEANQNVGVITLNRPKQLNAVNSSMIQKIALALKEWEQAKALVIIKGEGTKAFCAGGDVRAIAEASHKKDYSLGENFFRMEYKLNSYIGKYKLPYIALIDGITMGGGVGLSVHGRYRVATERTLFAMPETAIGFFPDVGGSFFLPRLEGYLGLYLALTGTRLKGADNVHANIATHYCESKNLPALFDELLKCRSHYDVREILEKFQPRQLPEFSLKNDILLINDSFSPITLDGIFHKLKTLDTPWAQQTMKTLDKMSPTSLKVTHAQFYKGMMLTLDQCLDMELVMAKYAIRSNDFYEGVRSVLIDKDGKPKWNPNNYEAVTKEIVNAYFPPDNSLKNKL